MYGNINKAIEELVVQIGGEETWQAVCNEAGLESFTFVSQEIYPDKITYDLVDAVAKVTGQSTEQVLVAFGEHWSRYTGNQGYGHMFKMLGRDLQSFLLALPRLHDHVAFIFPEIVMPQFECKLVQDGVVRVLYRSERVGLAPMVFGLLEGMAKVYETVAEVRQVRKKSDDHDADEFEVRIIS
jgi:Haem-NO-binding